MCYNFYLKELPHAKFQFPQRLFQWFWLGQHTFKNGGKFPFTLSQTSAFWVVKRFPIKSSKLPTHCRWPEHGYLVYLDPNQTKFQQCKPCPKEDRLYGETTNASDDYLSQYLQQPIQHLLNFIFLKMLMSCYFTPSRNWLFVHHSL
jgi:hypothetical protein